MALRRPQKIFQAWKINENKNISGSECYLRNIGSRCFSDTCPNGESYDLTVLTVPVSTLSSRYGHRVAVLPVTPSIYLLLHIPTVLRETDDLTPPPPSR